MQLLSSYGASRSFIVSGASTTAFAVSTQHGHAELAAWLQATEQWSTPLHHLSLLTPARARSLLRGGASLHAAATAGGPTPLLLARAINEGNDAADEESAAALVLQAARPWAPNPHSLSPEAPRSRAVELLIIGHRLSREPRFAAVAQALLDVWVEWVMPHAVRREDSACAMV